MPQQKRLLSWLIGDWSQNSSNPPRRKAEKSSGEWKIKVATPICIPARRQISSAMGELGALYGSSVAYRIEGDGFLGNLAALSGAYDNARDSADPSDYPVCATSTIVVPVQRARWTEYLILRQRKMCIVSSLYDERNRQWASGHGWGSLPIAWNRKNGGVQPWATKGCSDATPKLQTPPPKRR